MPDQELTKTTFLATNPHVRNVFAMMRYRRKPYFEEVEQTLRQTFGFYGLRVHLAKDGMFVPDLWGNITIYMDCCQYGVAVFDDFDQRDFSANVAIELGYMLAQTKRCLILKEDRLPQLPTDICGLVYSTFDMTDVKNSIPAAVHEWMRANGLLPPLAPLTKAVREIVEYGSAGGAKYDQLRLLWALQASPLGSTREQLKQAVPTDAESGVRLSTALQALTARGLASISTDEMGRRPHTGAPVPPSVIWPGSHPRR